ncbi:MAG: serine hydrolase [Clostridia bacterium]|nr:serine hydrolase [Clostridia bacterium]
MDKFIAPSVNIAAVNRFFDKMKEKDFEIHTLEVFKNGETKLRIALPPYSCTDTPEVYSLSKTFTSTVVGIAVDKGFLSVEDYVLKFFPEIETDCEHFHKLKVKHVLSMNTGQGGGIMWEMLLSDNALKSFFSFNPAYEPGSYFTYNTGATCLLGMIVSRATGMDFFDFAAENLFYPMDMHNVYWLKCKDGSCQCGSGIHISSDDTMKFFRMYLDKGIWNGKRIISESWIAEATSPVPGNTHKGTQEWVNQYGYQIWLQENGIYRGDGALGQLGIVIPEKNAVVVMQSHLVNPPYAIDAAIELVSELDGNEEGTVCDYSFPPYERSDKLPCINRIYRLKENPQDLRSVHLVVNDDGATLSFTDGGGNIINLNAGNGYWRESSFTAKNMTPYLKELPPNEMYELLRTAACVKAEEDKLVFRIRYLSNPHTEHCNISFTEDTLDICISLAFINGYEPCKNFSGTRIG